MENTLLFVYGSLRQGHHNHHRLASCEYKGTFKTHDIFKMFGLRSRAYPYAFFDAEGVSITGEVYSVNPTLLERLDDMEGHPGVYCRTPIRVHGLDDTVHMYVLVDASIKKTLQKYGHMSSRFVPILSGDWAEFTHNRQKKTNAPPP